MAKPRIAVSTVPVDDEIVERGTIMELNMPPTMLVMVTDVHSPDVFAGVCLEDGVHYAVNESGDGGWLTGEFHVFKGSVTLTQGV